MTYKYYIILILLAITGFFVYKCSFIKKEYDFTIPEYASSTDWKRPSLSCSLDELVNTYCSSIYDYQHDYQKEPNICNFGCDEIIYSHSEQEFIDKWRELFKKWKVSEDFHSLISPDGKVTLSVYEKYYNVYPGYGKYVKSVTQEYNPAVEFQGAFSTNERYMLASLLEERIAPERDRHNKEEAEKREDALKDIRQKYEGEDRGG